MTTFFHASYAFLELHRFIKIYYCDNFGYYPGLFVSSYKHTEFFSGYNVLSFMPTFVLSIAKMMLLFLRYGLSPDCPGPGPEAY